jgi:hypothetical protein
MVQLSMHALAASVEVSSCDDDDDDETCDGWQQHPKAPLRIRSFLKFVTSSSGHFECCCSDEKVIERLAIRGR